MMHNAGVTVSFTSSLRSVHRTVTINQQPMPRTIQHQHGHNHACKGGCPKHYCIVDPLLWIQPQLLNCKAATKAMEARHTVPHLFKCWDGLQLPLSAKTFHTSHTVTRHHRVARCIAVPNCAGRGESCLPQPQPGGPAHWCCLSAVTALLRGDSCIQFAHALRHPDKAACAAGQRLP